MKNRNNTWTIIRKEFARFFGDRQLVFTTVIMPGLLIYLIYSLMQQHRHHAATRQPSRHRRPAR